MKLNFFTASEYENKAKATVHKTGKIGFSTGAIDYLQISEKKFIKFAKNEDDENDANLYAIITSQNDENCFRIIKSGNYFYVNTKGLFDKLEIDYTKKTYIYDLIKIEIEGNEIIKMIRREIPKNKKGGSDK